jgi:mRNA interferase RelE/StbE
VSYEVRLRRAAQKELDSLSAKDYQAVARVIDSIEVNPRPHRVKKLVESGLWRVRLIRYRIVYAIDDTNKLVIIVRVARRKEDTYKGI